MPDGETTVVRNPLGSIVEIPTAQLVQAQQQGYQLATPTEARGAKLEARYGGLGHQALALTAGIGSGLTLGGTDYLVSKLDEDARKALAAYREVHPGTLMAGEIIGGVGGVALGGMGGVGTLARVGRALGAPTRAVTRIATGLGRVGRAVPGAPGRLLGAGIEAGVEAGIEVLGHTIGEAAIQNQELTGEKLAAAMGTGALYGGAFGAGLTGIGMGLGGARRRLAKALGSPDAKAIDAVADGAFGEAAPGVGRKISDRIAKLSSAISGKDEGLIRRLGAFDAAGAEMRRRAVFEGDDIVNRLAGDFEESLNATQRALETTRIGAGGALKAEHVRRIIRRDNPAEQLVATQRAFAQARDVLEEIVTDKAKHYTRNAKKLQQRLDYFEGVVEKAALKGDDISATAFTQLDAFKREWQQLAKQARRSKDARSVATHELLRATDDKLFRPLLQSTDTWGDVGKFQQLINAAWTEGLAGPLQTVQRGMMSRYGRVAGDPYQDAFVANRQGIEGYLRGLDNPNKSLQHRGVKEYLDFLDSYSDAATKTLDLSPAERAQFEELRKQATKLRGFTDEAGTTVAAANQFKALTADDGSGMLGAALGGGLAGLVASGDADPTWAAGGAIFGALAKPGASIRRLAAMEQLGRQLDTKISTGLRKTFRQARPLAVKAVAPGARAAARAEDRQQRIAAERREMAIASITAQPQTLRTELSSLYSGLTASAPGTTQLAADTSQRAIDYLASQLPPVPVRYGILGAPGERLAPSEAVTFNRKAAAVEEPWSLPGLVASGELTADQVRAVEVVYPELLQDIRAQALAQADALQGKGRTLPYETAGQLSTLLGAPVVAAHHPEMAAAAQAAFATQRQQPAPEMTRRPRERVADYASEMRTPREALGHTVEA